MRQIRKKIITATYLVIGVCITATAQTTLKHAQAELYKVNKVFDSSRYLGFDVIMEYKTDTLLGEFRHEEMTGNYILNNRNIYYKMGDAEYIQNDSFVYNLYHDEKMMMMTKDLSSNSSLFPLKEFVDSITDWYASVYTFSVRYEDDSSTKVIEFIAPGDTILPYQQFAVYYEPESYYPEKFEMTMQGEFDLSAIPDSLLPLVKIKPMRRTVTMRFENYFHPNSLEVFADSNYVVFDRLRKMYKPADKFKGYRFLTNGIEGEEHEEAIELYPPPQDEDQ